MAQLGRQDLCASGCSLESLGPSAAHGQILVTEQLLRPQACSPSVYSAPVFPEPSFCTVILYNGTIILLLLTLIELAYKVHEPNAD